MIVNNQKPIEFDRFKKDYEIDYEDDSVGDLIRYKVLKTAIC